MTSSRRPLLAITALRFFAALMVVASHLLPLATSNSSRVAWVYAHVFYEGYVGVTFFFVLSGFILSYSYCDRAKAGRLSYIDFMFTRIARIFPLHVLTLLMALPLALYGVLKHVVAAGSLGLTLPLNAALLQAYVPAEGVYFSLNAPSWSLSVEMFFYALFPALLSLRSRSLTGLALIIVLAKWGCSTSGSEETVHFFAYIFPPLRLVDFVIGILLFRLYKRVRAPSSVEATLAQLISFIVLVTFFCLRQYVSQAARYDLYYIIPMSMLVMSFSWDQGLLARAISVRTLVFLGEASFALYLVHQLVIRYSEPVRLNVLHLSSVAAGVGAAVVYVFASIGLSALLFSLFEMRAKELTLEALRNWWKRRKASGRDRSVREQKSELKTSTQEGAVVPVERHRET